MRLFEYVVVSIVTARSRGTLNADLKTVDAVRSRRRRFKVFGRSLQCEQVWNCVRGEAVTSRTVEFTSVAVSPEGDKVRRGFFFFVFVFCYNVCDI